MITNGNRIAGIDPLLLDLRLNLEADHGSFRSFTRDITRYFPGLIIRG